MKYLIFLIYILTPKLFFGQNEQQIGLVTFNSFLPYKYESPDKPKSELDILNFVPSKNFLLMNPDFLLKGTFSLNSSLIKNLNERKVIEKLKEDFGTPKIIGQKLLKSGIGEWDNKYDYDLNLDSIFNLNSNSFPAIKVKTENKLDYVSGNIIIDGTKRNDLIENLKGDYNKITEKAIYKNVDYDFNEIHNKLINNDYAILKLIFPNSNDESYKKLNDKIYNYVISKNLNVEDIILEVKPLKIIPISSDIFGLDYPSYIIYKLDVKGIDHSIIKSYFQTILFTSKYKLRRWSPTSSVDYNLGGVINEFFINNAFKNLMNQFANDTTLKKYIINYQNEKKRLSAENVLYSSYIKDKMQIEALDYYKSIMIKGLINVNLKLKSYNQPELLGIGKMDIASLQNINNNADNAISTIGNIGSAILNNSSLKNDKKSIDNLRTFGEFFIKTYEQIDLEENNIINSLDELVKSKFIMDGFFEVSDKISKTYIESKNGFSSSHKIASDANQKAKSDFKDNLSKQIVSEMDWGNSNNNISGTNKSNSSQVGGSSMNSLNSDDCINRAKLEWYKSKEYNDVKKSGFSTSPASLAKAKLAELTLKYCSSKLTSEEILAIKKMIAIERENASHQGISLDFSH